MTVRARWVPARSAALSLPQWCASVDCDQTPLRGHAQTQRRGSTQLAFALIAPAFWFGQRGGHAGSFARTALGVHAARDGPPAGGCARALKAPRAPIHRRIFIATPGPRLTRARPPLPPALCSAQKQQQLALPAGVIAAAGAALANPLVAEAASVTPSLRNFLYSLIAGATVLGALGLAVTAVSNFDPVKRG